MGIHTEKKGNRIQVIRSYLRFTNLFYQKKNFWIIFDNLSFFNSSDLSFSAVFGW